MNAVERGMSYLSIKPRTELELRKYLKDKGYTIDEIDCALEQLIQCKYIDDEAYTRMYIEYASGKGRGQQRIRRELITKGIDRNVIEDVIYSLEDNGEMPDGYQIALGIGQSVVGDINLNELEFKERKKLEARIGRRLISRGFNNSVVFAVIREIGEQNL